MKGSKLQGMALPGIFVMMLVAACNTQEPQYTPAQVGISNGTFHFSVEGGYAEVQVTSNRAWVIAIEGSGDVSWLNTTPGGIASVEGNGTLKIAVAENQESESREAKVVIQASSATAVVTISQFGKGGVAGAVIFSEHCGTPAQTGSAWPSVSDYTGWQRGGPGGGDATYSGSNGNPVTSVRTTVPSAGYAGASGSGSIFFGGSSGEWIIDNIDMAGHTQFVLKFGISNSSGAGGARLPVDAGTVGVFASVNHGVKWTRLEFVNAPDAAWVLATAPFNVLPGSTRLSLRFTASATLSAAVRIDDITLYEGSGGIIEVGAPEPLEYRAAALSGALIKDEISTAKIVIPYLNGDGRANPVIASFTGGSATAGLGIGSVTPAYLASGGADGHIEIPLMGTPTTTGTVEVTVEGVELPAGHVMILPVIDITDIYPAGTVAAVSLAGLVGLGAQANNPSTLTFENADTPLLTLTRLNPGTGNGGKFAYTASNASLYTGNWHAAVDDPAWEISVPMYKSLYGTIHLEYAVWGTATSPLTWEVYCSMDGGAAWSLAQVQTKLGNNPFGTLGNSYDVVTAGPTGEPIEYVKAILEIPQEKILLAGHPLLVRIIPKAGTSARNGAAIASSGNTRIGNGITFTKEGEEGSNGDTYPVGTVASAAISELTGTSVAAPVTFTGGITVSKMPSNPATFSVTASSASLYTANWFASTGAGASVLPGVGWALSAGMERSLYGEIQLTYNTFGTSTSPAKWAIQYSLDQGVTWLDSDTYTAANPCTITATAAPGNAISDTFTIPEAGKLVVGDTLRIKVYPLPANDAIGGTPNTGGNNRLAGTITIARRQ